MAIGPGSRVGPYEITALIGEGGMGRVWRAHHAGLRRDDALKVLPDAFASNPDRLARFQREAQVLASLNHPNIAHVYGLEQADGAQAIVMELVEGPTLADRITRGPLPVEDALAIARQVAEALAAAHGQGIIHRDLKPANIKVRPDGTVKVLDFGLAKALDATSPERVDATASPTLTSPVMATGAGVLLGTAAYMSPEQAKGRFADKRSDIWAYGCVLYEMLTGRAAFAAEDVSDTLANVLKGQPDWTVFPADVPEPVRALLQRCLEKDPRRRVADIAVALFVMDELRRFETLPGRQRRSFVRARLPIAVAIAVAIVAGALGWMLKPAPIPAARPAARFIIDTGIESGFSATGRHLVAISPQGTHLVYSTDQRLYLRPLNRLDASPLRGTEPQPGQAVGNTAGSSAPGREPFFSPDGQWIGFWQEDRLKKMSLAGGPAVVLAPAPLLDGASWAADDMILYGQGAEGIWRVPAAGGQPENLVKMEPGQIAMSPQMLPGGRAVLFTRGDGGRSWNDAQIVVYRLDSRTSQVVLEGGADARYADSGHLVYARADTLFAVPFDVRTLTVRGSPVPVIEGIARSNPGLNGVAHFGLSSDGVLVYVPATAVAATTPRALVWVDRAGHEDQIDVPPRGYSYPRLSLDGTQVALESRDADAESEIWVLDLVRLTLNRLTVGPPSGRSPMWTADGRRVIFNAGVGSGGTLMWQAADGSGTAEPVPGGAEGDFVTDTTADGTGVIVTTNTPTTADVGMLLPFLSPAASHRLVRSQFSERNGVVSRDGRWLAYESNASGRLEIYVRRFPQTDSGQWLVSTNGGSRPLWSRNGRELFYLAGDGTLMSVPVESAASWKAGAPVQLLRKSYFPGALSGFNYRPYDVSPDDQRFLMIQEVPETQRLSSDQRGIVVVVNWPDELTRVGQTN